MRRNFNQFQLVRFAELPWTPDPSAEPTDKNSLPQKIKDVLARVGVQGNALACGLSGKEIIVRYLDMPALPKDERKTAIRYQAQKYISFEMKELYCNFDAEVDRQSKRMKVLFLAVKKSVVHDYLALFSSIGYKIAALEPAALSLIRALFHAAPSKNVEPTLILDVHNDGAVNIVVSKNNMILLSRDCNISKFSEPPAPLDFTSLTGEVRLTLNYFSRNFEEEKISRIVLCAENTPELADWEERLRGEFGVPVQPGVPAGFVLDKEAWLSPAVLVAVGLAMRQLDDTESSKLNLTPEESEKSAGQTEVVSEEREKTALQKSLVTQAVCAVVFLLAAHFFLSFRVAALNREISSEVPLVEVRRQESELTAENSFLKSLINGRVYVTKKMSELARTVPTAIQLLSWRYTDSETESTAANVSSEFQWQVYTESVGNALLETNRFVAALKNNADFMAGFGLIRMNPNQDESGGANSVFKIDCLTAGGG